jgi:predicted lipase
LALYPNTSIAITGHSLGAAMAAHCSAEFVNKGYKIKTTYSYGMPRVGNQAFEQWYVSVVPGTFRVVHRKDPVPHLPYERWGFHHMPYEVSIT